MSDELNPYPGNLKHHKVDAPARHEPLLSDDAMDDMMWLSEDGKPPRERVRDFYESARANDAELIQRLANDVVELQAAYAKDTGRETSIGNEALKAAIAQGFKL